MQSPSPSRKVETVAGPGACPRCGVRLHETYKYCPNCAYRLRPELIQTTPPPAAPPSRGHRLIALGGYLGFASMLLLVVFAGFRLFTPPGSQALDPGAEAVVRVRDAPVLALDPSAFVRIDAGPAWWGYSDPPNERHPVTSEVEGSIELCPHEITNDQYYAFLLARAKATGRDVPLHLFPTGWKRRSTDVGLRSIYDPYQGDLPVTGVSFYACLEFCAWVWHKHLDADPNRLVDLPTWLEYARAGRGEVPRNLPWERRAEPLQPQAVLDAPAPLKVTDENVGVYDGVYGLVGNVAEWVHGTEPHDPYVVGWSHRDYTYRGAATTPFGPDGINPLVIDRSRSDVGFRIVIRDAPALPSFVRVKGGVARMRASVNAAAKELAYARSKKKEPALPLRSLRHPYDVLSFDTLERTVKTDFDISRAEITNRQYLYFWSTLPYAEAISRKPAGWLPGNPWHAPKKVLEMAIFGHYGEPPRPDELGRERGWFSYPAGADNAPVQGVRLEDTEAYVQWLSRKVGRRCRIPTLAEFLRAGRGDTLAPYPPSANVDSRLLICSPVPETVTSPVALLSPDGPPIVGLAGNLPEYVHDTVADRVLLAGGHYSMPPEFCTLDSLWDPAWEGVEYDVFDELVLQTYTVHFPAAGIRVVRERRPY